MKFFYRFLYLLASMELAFAIYRRDLIDDQIMTGIYSDVPTLMDRRNDISAEIALALDDMNRCLDAIHSIDERAAA